MMKSSFVLCAVLATLTCALPSQITLQTESKGLNGLLEAVALSGDFSHPQLAALVDTFDSSMKSRRRPQKPTIDESAFEIVSHKELPDHRMRIKEPKSCDGTKSYSGYLDISETRHLYFQFFESRSDPATDPFVQWNSGGPGCASSIASLFELGPCLIAENGTSTVVNPFSWNTNANLLFIDNPINTGYSYAENESINNTPDAAKDIYAFLQLFYKRFPHLLRNEFHLSGESYGGHYIPHFASKIWEENKKITHGSGLVSIPLKSVLIGNGLTDPRTHFKTVPDFACAPSKTAIYDDTTCFSVKSKVPTCTRLAGYCYDNPSRLTCVPAYLYCWSNIAGPIQKLAINPYDVRRSCNRNGPDGPLCYKELQWIETYLNDAEVKKDLGVPADLQFESCNMQVNQAFAYAGDGMHNSAALLPPMLAEGLRVLIYAGDQDFMCQWIGNKEWPQTLESPFQKEMAGGQDHIWRTLKSKTNAGEVRQAGPGAGNFSFVRVFDSGHMVPADAGEAALDMFDRWLANIPLHNSSE